MSELVLGICVIAIVVIFAALRGQERRMDEIAAQIEELEEKLLGGR